MRLSSDPNLTIRILRELREDIQMLRGEVRRVRECVDGVDQRLATVESALGGMAAHLFSMTGTLKVHERRLRKLEAGPRR